MSMHRHIRVLNSWLNLFSGVAREGIINIVCCTSECFVCDVAVDFFVLDVCMHGHEERILDTVCCK